MSSSIVELQLRLLLEQQCAEVGRGIAATVGETEAGFLLLFADFGQVGNLGFFANVPSPAPEAAARRWLSEGGIPKVARPHPNDDPLGDDFAGRLAAAADARRLADHLAKVTPAGVGFVFLLWIADINGLYLSSADRKDVRRVLQEWLDRSARP
jgi:hypothetical protein